MKTKEEPLNFHWQTIVGWKPGTMQLAFIIIAGLVLLVGAAYLVMVVYDIPVRKYLSYKRSESLSKQKAVGV
jgi:hypothetical protein